MARLSGKVAILSGAARGMGQAEARLFAREGARVILADVLGDELEVLAADINAAAADEVALPLRLDVRRQGDWTAAVDLAEARWGGVDILINNAGIVSWGNIETTTEEEWQRTLAVNQTGTWLGMKAVIPSMRRRGGGSIVNISSIGGLIGTPAYAAYQATKGAVRMLAKHGAIAFGADNIRCNTIFPGSIATAMLEELVPTREGNEKLARACALKRIGQPEDIAYAALFLASDEARYITGADLAVDGGFTAA